MTNLFTELNITTNKQIAPLHAESISFEEFQNEETCDLIHEKLEELEIDNSLDGYNDCVETIQNYLNSAYEGETAYFWMD